ncbi:MAG: DUF99 family protein [Halobacteriales archaeon]|nr:DUF99 family protein [Halobacteriales archaeon]
MKKGVRALGVAESYRGESGDSYLAGAVVRADRVVEGFRFTAVTVGGTGATEAVVGLHDAFEREDVRFVLVSGIAPAWYNIVNLRAVHDAVDVPVVSVTYEEGDENGLRSTLEDEFEGDALDERLALYDALTERRCLVVGGNDLYIRSVGVSDERADEWVRGFTHEGTGRPEPVRIARLAARGLLEFLD